MAGETKSARPAVFQATQNGASLDTAQKWRVTQIFCLHRIGLILIDLAMYILVNRDEDSSVYNYIAEQLLNGSLGHKKWTLAPKNSERFNLLFGERKSTQLDYTRIGKLCLLSL